MRRAVVARTHRCGPDQNGPSSSANPMSHCRVWRQTMAGNARATTWRKRTTSIAGRSSTRRQGIAIPSGSYTHSLNRHSIVSTAGVVGGRSARLQVSPIPRDHHPLCDLCGERFATHIQIEGTPTGSTSRRWSFGSTSPDRRSWGPGVTGTSPGRGRFCQTIS